MPSRRHSLRVLLVLALLAGGLAVVAGGSPTPDDACPACGTGFATAAGSVGISVDVTNSTARIELHENGSATWTVRNRLTDASAEKLEDASARSRITAAVTGGSLLPHDHGEDRPVEAVSSRIDGNTVVLSFRDPAAAQRQFGLLVVDYFHSDGYGGGTRFESDRLTVVGPDGTVVVNDPISVADEYTQSGAVPSVSDRTTEWTTSGATTPADTVILYEDVYLVYGERGTSSLRVDAAVALATAPIWVDNVREFVVPAALLAVFAFAGVGRVSLRLGRTPVDTETAAKALALVGGIGAPAALVQSIVAGGPPEILVAVPTVYAVVGATVLRRPSWYDSPRGVARVCGLSVIAVGALLALGNFGWPGASPLASGFSGALLALPVAVAPLLGVFRTRTAAVVGALAVVAAGGAFVPAASRPWGLLLFFTLGGVLLATLLALPPAALAARVASERLTRR